MGRNTLIQPWKVTCGCHVVYPNRPDLTHEGRITVAQVMTQKLGEDFINYCLNGYYYQPKVERND